MTQKKCHEMSLAPRRSIPSVPLLGSQPLKLRAQMGPLGAGPVDVPAPGASCKPGVLLSDEGGHPRGGFFAGDWGEEQITLRATAGRLGVEIQAEAQLRPELAQLVEEMVALDQRMTVPDDLALRQVPVSREEPSVFLQHALNEHVIRDDFLVGRVVSHNPQPAGKPAEHGVRKKGAGRIELQGRIPRGPERPAF